MGIPDGINQDELENAYKEKKREIKLRMSDASTAILKQVNLAEMKNLEESKSIVLSKRDTKNHVSPLLHQSKFTISKLSIIISILWMIIVVHSIGRDKISDYWSDYSPQISQQLSTSQTNVNSLYDKIKSQATSFTEIIKENSNKMDISWFTWIEDNVENLINVDIVNNTNNITQTVVASRNLAETVAEDWEAYRKQYNIPDIPQSKTFKRLLDESHSYFRKEMIDQAQKGYEKTTLLGNTLFEKIKPVVDMRLKSEAARLHWYSYKESQQLYGKEIEDIDKHYLAAKKLEQEGLFLKAISTYQSALSAYETALANGPQLIAKNTWLTKMRRRLAEIEKE